MGFMHVFICFMLLRLITFNARGLLDIKKFEKVREMCRGDDVILLQETNWRESVMTEIRKKWNGGVLYNNGDERLGRRVAISIKENSGVWCQTVYEHKEGKCIAVEMEYKEK